MFASPERLRQLFWDARNALADTHSALSQTLGDDHRAVFFGKAS